MKRKSQTALVMISCAVMMAGCHSPGTGMSRCTDEHRQIAEACLTMLRSSLASEGEIRLEDPRIPEKIRALKPVQIEIQGTDVVIMRSSQPREYHLSRLTGDRRPWVLYAAGPGYVGHQELLRLDHE